MASEITAAISKWIDSTFPNDFMGRAGTVNLCLSMVVLGMLISSAVQGKSSAQASTKAGSSAQATESDRFASWQKEYLISGENGPLENPDGDAWCNLLEFALGLRPDTGLAEVATALPSLRYRQATGKFEFEYQRLVGAGAGLTFSLLTTGYDGFEQISSLTPKMIARDGGLERVVYADIEQDAAFQGLAQGKLRLRVSRELKGGKLVTAESPLWCWARKSFLPGAARGFTMPLVRQEVYRGPVVSTAAEGLLNLETAEIDLRSVLDTAESYYVEVLDGVLEGQRWEVDVPACTESGLALDLISSRNTTAELPDLAGMSVIVRPHLNISSVLRTDRLQAATRMAQADRVQFWERESSRYAEYWLALRGGSQRNWVSAGDANFADSGQRVILPGEGLFVNPRSLLASLPLVGLCRDSDLLCIMEKGTHLVGTGWTATTSAEQLGMTGKQGFCAHTSHTQATRLRLWDHGTDAAAGLVGYFYRSSGSGPAQWVMEGDADLTDQSAASRVNGFEAYFLIHPGATKAWRQPAQKAFNDSDNSP